MERPVTAPERSGIIRDPRPGRERGFLLCGAPNDAEIEEVKSAVLAKLALAVGKDPSTAVDRDWFVATALTIRDRVMHRWLASDRESQAKGRKRVYYLSLEFLIGRLLGDVLGNLALTDFFHTALGDLCVDLNVLTTAGPDAAPGHCCLCRRAASLDRGGGGVASPRPRARAAWGRRRTLPRPYTRRRARLSSCFSSAVWTVPRRASLPSSAHSTWRRRASCLGTASRSAATTAL